jgi:chemotaxis protein methyltransferase CheR
LDKMTINVSEFFRNKDRWDNLCELLQQQKCKSGRFEAWSAACSTGEEPYTLAIVMEQVVSKPYHILATDIDENVIQLAKGGKYRAHQVKVIPPYAERYFHQQASEWVIDSSLRENITFRKHNLLSDDYPDSLNLIVCRNVLIYFTDDAKQQIIGNFSEALQVGGLLFVGSTEQFLRTDLHGLVQIAPFIYRKEA